VIASFAGLLLLGQPCPAPADQTVTVAFTDDKPVSCTGEMVHLEGQTTIVTKVFSDSSGRLHVNMQFSTHATGTDVNGQIYQFHSDTKILNNIVSAQTFTEVERIRSITPGPTDNYCQDRSLHFTIDVNGNITAFHGTAGDVECRG
jgi:hypothetical protein